jgi:SAM-dependent methyltransferase
VLATEVLEHLPAHSPILNEISRILKPGGRFIFTTPNIHRLSSRFKFLGSGTFYLNGARLGWDTPANELYSTHHNPVYVPVIHSLLYQQGFRTFDLGLTHFRLSSVLLLPLYPIVLLGAWLETRHIKKKSKAGAKDLFKKLTSPKLHHREQLMVIAQKD